MALVLIGMGWLFHAYVRDFCAMYLAVNHEVFSPFLIFPEAFLFFHFTACA